MTERVTSSRLRRLEQNSSTIRPADEATARAELAAKLDQMGERLRASGPFEWGDQRARAEAADAKACELWNRLRVMVSDESSRDSEIQPVLDELRRACLWAEVEHGLIPVADADEAELRKRREASRAGQE